MTIKGQKIAGLAAATVAALYSVPSLSAIQLQTWNFDSASQSFNNTSFGNSLTQANGGVNLTTTGWSDTDDVTGADKIETGKLIWAQSAALGIQNRDEDTTSPNHSVDSVTSDTDGEYDMLLLTFDTAVKLTGIDLAWAVGGNAANTADVSILAWNGTGSAALGGRTWGGVLSNYTSVGNYANVGLAYYALNSAIESTTWLVGVYNPVFAANFAGDFGDDGLKLAQVTTSTTTDRDPPPVPVPGTVALILAGLLALRARKPGKLRAA
jgi:hypothetical protein